uniref:Dienelactone hydrolase family protein n=1 Tax=Phenylobacterium glaciei TaxID=2803784 RepID=A0A974P1T5_9CAUL|nr:dienelactone hydrolase family protein [Phenylobacterium glaciei]
MPQSDDPLTDFEPREITLEGATKVVHIAGTGPAVIVMTEMPGISPHVARFARWVRDAGFTVYMPSLFGRDGAVPGADEGGRLPAGLCQRRVPRLRSRRLQPRDHLAPRPRPPGPCGVRRSRRRGHRHVLHRQLRPDHDAGKRGAGAGAVPTLPAPGRSRRPGHRARRARRRACPA